MKPLKNPLKVLCLVLLISIISCKDKSPKPNPALASIDLKRGELLLCSTEQFGDVNFSLDCHYEVRETFDLAISLLHSFEYAEAEKTFVKVIDMDPECAMAYWGVTMSIYHDLWAPPSEKDLKKGLQLLKITENLPKSDIAAQYIDAISVFYNDWETKDHNTRELLYEKKMEVLYNSNKDDAEATVFYALALTSTADPNDKTYKNQKKAGALLEKLFVEKPNHPGIAHYIIHSYDYPELAQMGLNTARRYAEIAPASAHAQHMPSHIFTRLGLWDESISTNINSASSAICYAESVNPEASWTQEIHAVDYLVYAYLQMGDNKNALEQLKDMQTIKTVFPKDDFASVYALTAIPVRIVLENKNWKEVSNLELPKIDFTWEKFSWEKAIFHFGKSLSYSHIGNVVSAEQELQILKDLHHNLLNSKDNFTKTYKANQVEIQIYAAQGWINLAKGNKEDALKFMKLAAKKESETSKHPVTPGEILPADELLGDLLLELNKPSEALEVYEKNLNDHPNRFNGVYGAAIAAEQSGNKEKAKFYFDKLIELTKSSNSDRQEVIEAKSFVSKIEI